MDATSDSRQQPDVDHLIRTYLVFHPHATRSEILQWLKSHQIDIDQGLLDSVLAAMRTG